MSNFSQNNNHYFDEEERLKQEDMENQDNLVIASVSSNDYKSEDMESKDNDALSFAVVNEPINDDDWERIQRDWEKFKGECRFPRKDISYVIQQLEAHAKTMDGNEDEEPTEEGMFQAQCCDVIATEPRQQYCGIGEGEGTYLPEFNPHTDTKNYRLS